MLAKFPVISNQITDINSLLVACFEAVVTRYLKNQESLKLYIIVYNLFSSTPATNKACCNHS